MTDFEPQAAQPRVPLQIVLASATGLWLCYFVLTSVRAEILDLGFTAELLWRRAILTLIGIAITLGMWLILRLFDGKALWLKIAAALVIAAPVSILLAEANRLVFYDVEMKVLERMGEKQGLRVRRDEGGNLLVDVPISRLPGYEPSPSPSASAEAGDAEVAAASGATGADQPATADLPDAITINKQPASETRVEQLTETALGRYFLMLTWCALYLALLAGEQARQAERREGTFRRAAKAAELRSLRYQVNPHFLFNTLNSLSALVLTKRTEQAETMIQMISNFYRHSLADDPTADVPLREEFELQRLYLDIEKARFPERLATVFDLPGELAGALVPGMILQPLVENSVKHAVAPTSGKITLTLAAREEYGRLVITVSDDGKGAALGDGERQKRGHGIGLANVRDRLEARFGVNASIVSGPVEGGYATHIRIPLIDHE